jgi:hypothetical protein
MSLKYRRLLNAGKSLTPIIIAKIKKRDFSQLLVFDFYEEVLLLIATTAGITQRYTLHVVMYFVVDSEPPGIVSQLCPNWHD